MQKLTPQSANATSLLLCALCRQHFAPEVVRQLGAPLTFVDFLREPILDPKTGETLDAHPSFYESVPGGLPELRRAPLPLLPRVHAENCVLGRISRVLLC